MLKPPDTTPNQALSAQKAPGKETGRESKAEWADEERRCVRLWRHARNKSGCLLKSALAVKLA